MEGDCFVVRTVSGLPVDSIKFATLPPHFIFMDFEELEEINVYAEEQFGEHFEGLDDNEVNDADLGPLPIGLVALKHYLLASLVHHMDFLLENLHRNHPLRSTPLFVQPEMYEFLKPKTKLSLFSTHRNSKPYKCVKRDRQNRQKHAKLHGKFP
jgi:hypothetical protein